MDTPDHMYWVNRWSTKATSPTHTIKFVGKSTDRKKGPGLAWEFEFSTVPHRGGDGRQSFDKTGEGDAQRVFATAISAIKMFIQDVEPAMITFTADKGDDGASRTKLYQRMVQRLAPQLGFKPIVAKGDSMDTFTLVKEAWSAKYKKSIDCSNPKGFSQRAHCAGRKKNESINEESGKEMFAYFQKMHIHEPDNNSDMKQFILSHDWELRDFTPDMFPSEEDFFDYDDPFNRVIDVDYSHRVDLSQPIIVGPQYADGQYSVIDGNHRAATAQRMGNTLKGYFPVNQVPVKEAQVDEGVNDPHIFKAVFLAGGPGSGKSFVANNLLGGTGLRTVNSDDVYEFLMAKQGLELDPDTIASPQGQEIRGRAKTLTDNRMHTYLKGRIGLIIDGTGKDVAKYQKQVEKLGALGYDCMMIFVNTSEDVAQQRNSERKRSLPATMVTQMWNTVQNNLMKFQQVFGASRFHIIDNSGGLEDLDRKENFDKVYNETQRFLNTPPKRRAAQRWIQQQQKAQTDATQRQQQQTTSSDGGTENNN